MDYLGIAHNSRLGYTYMRKQRSSYTHNKHDNKYQNLEKRHHVINASWSIYTKMLLKS